MIINFKNRKPFVFNLNKPLNLMAAACVIAVLLSAVYGLFGLLHKDPQPPALVQGITLQQWQEVSAPERKYSDSLFVALDTKNEKRTKDALNIFATLDSSYRAFQSNLFTRNEKYTATANASDSVLLTRLYSRYGTE